MSMYSTPLGTVGLDRWLQKPDRLPSNTERQRSQSAPPTVVSTPPTCSPDTAQSKELQPSGGGGSYFTLDDVHDSRDYLIDLSQRADPHMYPPDVQAYLECVSRWAAKKPNGIMAKTDSKTTAADRYVPNIAAIQDGFNILLEQKLCGRGHFITGQFPTRALQSAPHYPWIIDMSEDEKRRWINQTIAPVDGNHVGYNMLFISNIRLPLPKGLVPPDRNPEWVALIGQLYGTQHPVIMFEDYPWLTDAEMDLLLGYEVAHLGGGDLPYPDIREDPDEATA